ncbi:putative sporulation protein YtxC [Caloramator sp. E03]|uniref:putative sporulation protein YtxC n=1 Tax=Caloramator sp. E03 TaxID=2576307 RepID=UPI0011107B33|nr:putative sporulation protein YtxC [Caloramator sp. E03]QCX32943.1 putative sporulation protein YtxC [Caloramator sp. E03]
MILLSVGYSRKSRDIINSFSDLCKFFKDKGMNIAIVENDVGNMHNIKCILRDTENDIKLFEDYRDMFYLYASNIIYDFICQEYELSLMDKILKERYSYLSGEDLTEIKKRCSSVIMGFGIFDAENILTTINRKNNMIKKIEEFLQESNEIILDGFITFRLKEMNSEIISIIDGVVEEYVLEKEYSEFIKLLKYFVEIQESRYDLINIIINEKGEYTIKDENGNSITKEFFEDFDIDNIKGEINKHDMLISALITCSPKKIIIHGIENAQCEETMETIKSIFLDKITICSGCELCKNLKIPAKTQKPEL